MPEKQSKVKVIAKYFDIPTNQMMKEIKALSDDEKLELAQGAARNLGLTAEEVNFELPA